MGRRGLWVFALGLPIVVPVVASVVGHRTGEQSPADCRRKRGRFNRLRVGLHVLRTDVDVVVVFTVGRRVGVPTEHVHV